MLRLNKFVCSHHSCNHCVINGIQWTFIIAGTNLNVLLEAYIDQFENVCIRLNCMNCKTEVRPFIQINLKNDCAARTIIPIANKIVMLILKQNLRTQSLRLLRILYLILHNSPTFVLN